MHSFLYLSQEDVLRCTSASMVGAVSATRDAILALDAGDSVMPPKSVLRWGDAQSEGLTGRVNALPAYVGGASDTLAIKWVASFPGNREKGLPRATALIIVNDRATGLPVAVMDGTYLNALRTAAVNLLAATYLCPEQPTSIGILGAGVQARFHLRAFLGAFPTIVRVRVHNRTSVRAERMHDLVGSGVDTVIVESAREAVSGVDVVVSATTAGAPIIERGWMRQGVTYFHFSGNECTYPVVNEFDKVFVDDWDAIAHRGVLTPALMHREGLFPSSRVAGTLGGLVSGRTPGRSGAERIMFCAMGLGVVDAAIAGSVVDEAQRRGFGRELMLWDRLDPLLDEARTSGGADGDSSRSG